MRTPTTEANACCAEFETAARLSRRRFLLGVAGASTAAVTTSVFGDAFRQTAWASSTGGNVLVVLSLRGGIDGLGLVVPHADPAYYKARPSIGLSKDSLVAKDEMFGLHPNMQPLEWLFTSGELTAVHAVGLPVPNRSHFSAIEEIEDADPGSTARSGWVNRMIGLNSTSDPVEAVRLDSTIVPTLMTGTSPVLASNSLSQISLAGATDHDPAWNKRRRTELDLIWQDGSGGLHDAYRSAIRTIDVLAPLGAAAYTPSDGVVYPTSGPAVDLADALRDTAKLIKADIGTDVVSIDYGTWDMHNDYGTPGAGDMQRMTAGFAGAVNAFMRDLGADLRGRVTLVTISEFGRRIEENGNKGLDHGWGNMMLVAGGGVDGGKYAGTWPGLGTGSNIDADLQVTTDYRNVLGEIMASRFPDRSLAGIFPGLSYKPVGVMKTSA